MCETTRVCTEREWEARAASLTTNRVCAPVKDCVAQQQYESAVPTTTSNRVCADVAPVCNASEWERAAPTLTSDRECRECRLACPALEYRVQPCGAASDTRCTACTRHVATHGTAAPKQGLVTFLISLAHLRVRPVGGASYVQTSERKRIDRHLRVIERLLACTIVVTTWHHYRSTGPVRGSTPR